MTSTFVCAALLIPLICRASDLVDLSVVTSGGYVTYTVPGDWKVLDMQTKPPTTSALFQIKNPADDGTPDSTNVGILTFETNSPEATASFEKAAAIPRTKVSTRATHGAWQLFTSRAPQGETMYQARYAIREVPGARVLVTFGWPELPRNPPHYNAQIDTAFLSLLDSVKGGLGPKPPTGGEVVRRPLNR